MSANDHAARRPVGRSAGPTRRRRRRKESGSVRSGPPPKSYLAKTANARNDEPRQPELGRLNVFYSKNKINKIYNQRRPLPIAREDGDNSRVEDSNARTRANTHAGTSGGEAVPASAEISWEAPLRNADVRARFEAMTAARLTREKTRREYWNRFETFAECERLWTVTKAKLASRKGRELLIRHYGHISERSRPFVLSGIKKVWTRGLELPWPLLKDDLPKPPRPRRGAAP